MPSRHHHITRPISLSQIVGVAPLASAAPMEEMGDEVSESFFAEGLRQEARGFYVDTPAPRRGSLDRVPRNRWPQLLFMGTLLSLGAGVVWWTGWRPPAEWQLSSLWQTVVDLAGR